MLAVQLAGIPVWIWASFLGFVLFVLALDLGVFHREAHKVQIKEALGWTGVWIALAMAFNAGIFLLWDRIQPGSALSPKDAGYAFLAGYVIEKALSVDNIFVFVLIFRTFRVPEEYRHGVLFWGILGALLFRAIFIAAGVVMLERFFWTMVVFGLFLLFTGVKMLVGKEKEVHPENNPLVRLFRRIVPVTPDYVGKKFFTHVDGRLWATPLFLVLLVVEFTDVIFAVDSIPAIFAITTNPFLVFTSNVFAILGLRALFFALAGLMGMFRYLSTGLAVVLMFVGGKMLYAYVERAVVPDWPKFPIALSLAIIVGVLAISIVASLVNKAPSPREADDSPVVGEEIER